MAKAVIRPKVSGITKTITTSDYPNTSITGLNHKSIISSELNITKTIETSSYPIVDLYQSPNLATIINTLPFRVRFTNIGIEGYSATNPAPIGIAIIGFNNYIL